MSGQRDRYPITATSLFQHGDLVRFNKPDTILQRRESDGRYVDDRVVKDYNVRIVFGMTGIVVRIERMSGNVQSVENVIYLNALSIYTSMIESDWEKV